MHTLPKNAKIYIPDNEIVGALQIVHGMAEHQLRYADFAEYLRSNGYVVITSDLRGHGDNITREEDLGYFGDNPVNNLINDVNEISIYIKDNYPDVPYFLLGHSMGTMICTAYFKKHNSYLSGLFLTGMPGKNPAAGAGILMCDAISSVKGEYYKSKALDNVLNGPFRRPFKSENCDVSWITSDPAVWELYENDPKCGFIFTVNGYKTVLQLMQAATGNSFTWDIRRLDIPIRFLSGADDPCMGGQAKMKGAVRMFKKAGYTDVQYKLYPGQRHEILNDTNKATVYEYILNEMNRIGKTK